MENSDVAIYELRQILDNPMFNGFASPDDIPSLLGRTTIHNSVTGEDRIYNDFKPEVPYEWDWSLVPLKQKWKPFELLGQVTPFNDFPCMDLNIPAFSERAVEVLEDFLTPNGELLPATFEGRTYYIYHCLNIVEILDRRKTIGAFLSSGLATSIAYLSVKPTKTDGLSIFKMRELPGHVFVHTDFVNRVQSNALNGFDFVKAWPMPEGSNYLKEHKKRRRETKEFSHVTTTKGLLPIKGHSIVLEFSLAGPKMSSVEKKSISRVQKELDAILSVHRLEDDYFGYQEGRRTVCGKCQIFLSCPNWELLLKKLKSWLTTRKWGVAPRVIVREFGFEHYDAEGVEIDLKL